MIGVIGRLWFPEDSRVDDAARLTDDGVPALPKASTTLLAGRPSQTRFCFIPVELATLAPIAGRSCRVPRPALLLSTLSWTPSVSTRQGVQCEALSLAVGCPGRGLRLRQRRSGGLLGIPDEVAHHAVQGETRREKEGGRFGVVQRVRRGVDRREYESLKSVTHSRRNGSGCGPRSCIRRFHTTDDLVLHAHSLGTVPARCTWVRVVVPYGLC